MNILALDMSSKTGWASLTASPIAGHGSVDQLDSGVQEFKLARGESGGARFMRFNTWLAGKIEGMHLVVYEQAHHRGGPPTELAIGFVTRVMEAAAIRGIEHAPVHSATLKKFATGKGNAQKPEMVEAAKTRYGVKIIDDNHADALLLLAYGVEKYGGAR